MKKMSEQEIAIDKQNSVEISINAKGDFSGKVKVYATTPEEAMLQTQAKANELENYIKGKNNR